MRNKMRVSLKKAFTILDGRLSTKMDDVYEMLNFIFSENLYTHQIPTAMHAYVYANHYDEHTDDVYTSWQLNHYEIAKKILKELKTEKQNGPYNKIQRQKHIR